MQNKKLIVGVLFILVFAFLGMLSVYNSSQSSKLASYQNKEGAPFVRDYSATFGQNKNGITIVEFIDPQCEACALFHPLSKRVFLEYEQEIQWVVRYLDNHQNSKYVIQLLEASKVQNKYNEVLDIIFDTQPLWSVQGQFKSDVLWQSMARIDGLNVEQLRTDFEKVDIENIVQTDRKDANSLGVRGTPSFFVNGIKLEKLSYQHLLDLVETQIYK